MVKNLFKKIKDARMTEELVGLVVIEIWLPEIFQVFPVILVQLNDLFD